MTPALPADERFLVRAQRLSVLSIEPDQVGALIVLRPNQPIPGMTETPDYHVLGQSFNAQRHDRVATAHAVLRAVEAACRHENRATLDRYGTVTCYTTARPCVMCLAALSYARVARVVYRRTYGDGATTRRQVDSQPDPTVVAAQLDFMVQLEHRP